MTDCGIASSREATLLVA